MVVDRGPLVTLEFRGDPLPPSRQAELVPIRREGSVDEDLLEDAQRNVEDYFRAQGYRDAEATYSREPSDGRLKIVFNVTRGRQYRLSAIEIAGNAHVPLADLRAGLRSQQGELFVRSALDADVAVLTERYRRLGFAAVTITPALLPRSSPRSPDQASMAIRLDVVEGPRTLIGTVTLEGNARVPSEVLRAAVREVTGRPFSGAELAQDREAVLIELLNRGYQTAIVEAPVSFSEDRTRADVRFLVREGPQILVDHVLIVGNTRTSAQTIERELLIEPGQPLAQSRLVESQRRLIALGLFRRVSVADMPRGSDTGRDVLVSVEEAPPTTFGYGGGVEGSRRLVREGPDGGQTVERFDFAPRGFFDIGRRNLWGKNRTVNLFARASFRSKDPTSVSTLAGTVFVPGGGLGVSEYRVQATYREPRVIGGASDLLVTGVAERGYRSSFNFDRQIGRAELVHRFSSSVSVSGRFSVESTYLFDQRFNLRDKLLVDRLFPQVRLSILAGTFARDRRDDALDPTSGTLASIDGDLALTGLGSEVGFAKSFVQGFFYRRVPGTGRIVFAGGARVGLAMGFATTAVVLDDEGNPVIGPDGRPQTAVVRDIPASERFYAGGATTIRGFTNDRIGTPDTIDRDGFPQGGMGMVILNAELRFPIWRWVGAVAFVDAGNVFARAGDIQPRRFRAAIGGGVRVRWPVLPIIRLDVGFNPASRLFQNGSREKSWAIYFGIGQAF
ncbi:MAG: BamA/TamA family outer membrane protein [Planctomycetes bacterium]|nr:BamA/TamA family outer membrane protein [Planctomycetota bacterium]